MPRQTKICRVCGKTYEACRSIKSGGNVFNWREVACSPECGNEYFRQIDASRRKEPEVTASVLPESPVDNFTPEENESEPYYWENDPEVDS